MKIKESISIALKISSILSFVYLLSMLYFVFVYNYSLWLGFLILVLFFSLSVWIIQSYIERYIYNKIKLIYKFIHDHKVKKTKGKSEKERFLASLDSVHQEVLGWSEDYEAEILQLKKLEKYRKEYIGNISHELKTPLFTILGYVSTLLDGGLKDDTINVKYLERSEKNISRLIRIVKELETIGQLESGELQLNYSSFDIQDLCAEVIESLDAKAVEKNTAVFLRKNHQKSRLVYADKNQIQRLLGNLIYNAIKYGYSNSGKVKISFFDMDTNILIEITDNGPGIEKENLPRIFERFYRTDKARNREAGGTGLGLAIVKHIVEAHHQTISVRSTIGIGTTFGFTLEKTNISKH
ncbi:MAG: two-component sensor histidine kinase [Bacteroidetes bacterium 4572_77]|nr:MAG: two-component sensor histidine kinase [Bacteroidetes bacterium 4572_77]